MKVVNKLILALAAVATLAGCGDNSEEEKFRQELINKALHDEVRKAGDAFLADNAKAQGVKTTASGLQYKVLVAAPEGGAHPAVIDEVVVHYEGMRIDGHIFDSSYQRGKPATFPLNRVIRGWTEGLSMMRKGDVWMLYIPPKLAYGATSPSTEIPANSTLIFKVELIDFRSPK